MRPLDFSRRSFIGNAAKFFGLGGAFAKLGDQTLGYGFDVGRGGNSPV